MSAVIPTLSINQPVLESRSDMMIYILKFLMMNPGWTSSWYDDQLLSMRKFMATYTEDRQTLVPALQEFLSNTVHAFYPEYGVEVKANDVPGDPTLYSMDIYIRDEIGRDVIELKDVTRDDSGVFVFKGVHHG